jgi:hypothetical protein
MFDEDCDPPPLQICRGVRDAYVLPMRRAPCALCALPEEGVKALFERVAIVLFERAVERARDAIATADSMNRNPTKVQLPPRDAPPSL